MSDSIAVTGSVAYDHIMNFPGKFKDHILADKLHILNVSFLVKDLRRLKGGCAANIAYAMALHGLKPRLVAAVGSDFAEYGFWLQEHGIDTSTTVVHEDMLTASCFITTDGDNNQITGFYPGAMVRAADIGLSSMDPKPALATISPNDPDAMRHLPSDCRKLGIPYLYDPGQQVIALSKEALLDGVSGAKVVVANDYEAAMIAQKTERALDDLLELCEAFVVTLGEKGCKVLQKGQDPLEVPAAPVSEAVDPTGAGDAFRGGFVKGLLSGADLATSARLGALTGAYCVEYKGTTAYTFDQEGFQRRYESAFGMPLAVS